MRASQINRQSRNLFVCAKGRCALPAASPFHRDALVQFALDTSVAYIDFISHANIGGFSVRVDSIIVARDGGRYAVDFPDARRLRDLDEEGLHQLALRELNLGVITLRNEAIRQEPRLSSAREVWSCSRVYVGWPDRAMIMQALERDGPLSLAQIGRRVQTDLPIDTAVYSLACDGSVGIDLDRPLSDATTVRHGSEMLISSGRDSRTRLAASMA